MILPLKMMTSFPAAFCLFISSRSLLSSSSFIGVRSGFIKTALYWGLVFSVLLARSILYFWSTVSHLRRRGRMDPGSNLPIRWRWSKLSSIPSCWSKVSQYSVSFSFLSCSVPLELSGTPKMIRLASRSDLRWSSLAVSCSDFSWVDFNPSISSLR